MALLCTGLRDSKNKDRWWAHGLLLSWLDSFSDTSLGFFMFKGRGERKEKKKRQPSSSAALPWSLSFKYGKEVSSILLPTLLFTWLILSFSSSGHSFFSLWLSTASVPLGELAQTCPGSFPVPCDVFALQQTLFRAAALCRFIVLHRLLLYQSF